MLTNVWKRRLLIATLVLVPAALAIGALGLCPCTTGKCPLAHVPGR